MSLSVTAYPFPWGRGVLLLEPIPASSQGKGRVLPGQVASLSQGPHWWAMWGSVSRSRTLRHAAQPGAGIGTSDLLITSRPALPTELQSPLNWINEWKKHVLNRGYEQFFSYDEDSQCCFCSDFKFIYDLWGQKQMNASFCSYEFITVDKNIECANHVNWDSMGHK